MARIADEDSEARRGAKPPLSLHPAFPAVVALWFAALLGLGMLVLPAALLERASLAAGLPALLPAAAPPLGPTARMLLALAAGGIGAVAGLATARRVAGAHAADTGAPPARERLARRAPEVRPLDIRRELGDDDAVVPAFAPPLRRRALALAEDDPPPPAEDPWTAPDERAEEFALREASPEAATLDDPVEPPATPPQDPETAAIDEDYAMTDDPLFHPLAGREGYDVPAPAEPAPEPLPFAAPVQARAADPVPPEPAPEPVAFRGDWEDTPLDRLGLVQLVERLGASLERRRLRAARSVSLQPVPAQPALPGGIDAAPAEEAAQAMASYFARPAAPAPEPEPAPRPDLAQRFNAMLGGDSGDDEDDDWAASLSLPLRRRPAARVESADEDDVSAPDERCGSLLAMTPSAARKTAEVIQLGEAPPAAAPPPAPSPVETDAALRAALETIQRMRATG